MTKRKTTKRRPTVDLYFAYGSNLDTEQMARRCPTARPIGGAKLDGFRLVFRGFADVERADDSRVPGGLWRVRRDDLAALDYYEGAPRFYRRFVVDVETARGETVRAWTYSMVDEREQMLPTQSYLTTIEAGYVDFGLGADLPELALAIKRAGAWLRRHDVRTVRRDGRRWRIAHPRKTEPVRRETTRRDPLRPTRSMSPATIAEYGWDWNDVDGDERTIERSWEA